MDFRAASQDFLRFCAIERQLSTHTLQAYAADLADFRRWLPIDTNVEDISEVTLKDYLAELVGPRKLTVATIRRRFACLRSFFRKAAKDGTAVDPFGSWRLQLPRRKRLPRSLSRGEISALLAPPRFRNGTMKLASDTVLQTVLRLIVSTGIRVGELCKLRLEEISPDAASLRIHGKGSRERIVYIEDESFRKELLLFIQNRRVFSESSASLFVNRCGSPMRPQSIRSRLRRHAGLAGLGRRITPHMLRHTAATLLIETGVDIRFVQRLLGHSSIATTEIYTHVSDEALRHSLKRADVLGLLGSR
jgi:integrase/recombinase XerD